MWGGNNFPRHIQFQQSPSSLIGYCGYFDPACVFCNGYKHVAQKPITSGMPALGTYREEGMRITETTSVHMCEDHVEQLSELMDNMKRGTCSNCGKEKTFSLTHDTLCITCAKKRRCQWSNCIKEPMTMGDYHPVLLCEEHTKIYTANREAFF